jgi:hypothetical protein
MSLLDIKRTPRTLYIIAPSLFLCHRTATHWGLDPKTMVNTRNITEAYHLAGTRAGTAFITFGREFWHETPRGFDLDRTVTLLQRTGKLRIAQDDDLDACRPFDALPSRPVASASQRVHL